MKENLFNRNSTQKWIENGKKEKEKIENKFWKLKKKKIVNRTL